MSKSLRKPPIIAACALLIVYVAAVIGFEIGERTPVSPRLTALVLSCVAVIFLIVTATSAIRGKSADSHRNSTDPPGIPAHWISLALPYSIVGATVRDHFGGYYGDPIPEGVLNTIVTISIMLALLGCIPFWLAIFRGTDGKSRQ